MHPFDHGQSQSKAAQVLQTKRPDVFDFVFLGAHRPHNTTVGPFLYAFKLAKMGHHRRLEFFLVGLRRHST
jgi:hypothetical protein